MLIVCSGGFTGISTNQATNSDGNNALSVTSFFFDVAEVEGNAKGIENLLILVS